MSSNRNSRPTPSMPQRIRPNSHTNNSACLDEDSSDTHEPLLDPEEATNGIPPPPSLSQRLPEQQLSSLGSEPIRNEGWTLQHLKTAKNFISENKAIVLPNIAILSIVFFFMLSLGESPSSPDGVYNENVVSGVGDISTGRGLHTAGQRYYENGLLDVSSTLFHIPAKAPTVSGSSSNTFSPTSTAIVHIVPAIPSSQQGDGADDADRRDHEGEDHASDLNNESKTAIGGSVKKDNNQGLRTPGRQTPPLNIKWSDLGYESGMPTPDPSKLPLAVSGDKGDYLNLRWSDLGYSSSSPTPDPAKLLIPASSMFAPSSSEKRISPGEFRSSLEKQSTDMDKANNNASPLSQGVAPSTRESEPITLPQPTAPGVVGVDETAVLPPESGHDSSEVDEIQTDETNQIHLDLGIQNQNKQGEEIKEALLSLPKDNKGNENEINPESKELSPTREIGVVSAEEAKRNLSPPKDNPTPVEENPTQVEENPTQVEERPAEVSSPVVDEPILSMPAKETGSSDAADPLLSASRSDGGSDEELLEQLPPDAISVENPQVITVPVDYPAMSSISTGGVGEGEGGQQQLLVQEQQTFSQMISAQSPLQASSSVGGGANSPNIFVSWTLPIMIMQQPLSDGNLQLMQQPQMYTEGHHDLQQQQWSLPSFEEKEAHDVSPLKDMSVEQNEREAMSIEPKPHNWDFNRECWSQPCMIDEEKPKYGMANEDNAIFEIFYTNPPKCCGVIVEIGAGDGFTNSASHFFEHGMGWKSVLVEAHPSMFEELEQNRPNAINVNAAFCEGDNTHLTYSSYDDSFHAMDGYTEVISERHAVTPLFSSSNNNDAKLVDCIHLQQVFNNLKITHVDVMIIKVEGDPLAVVRKMDWTVRVDVWIVLLDSNPDSTGSRDQLVRAVLEGNEYVQADWDIKRWCEVEGQCLANEVFLRKGFNPIPLKEETKRRLSQIFDSENKQRQPIETEEENLTGLKHLRGS